MAECVGTYISIKEHQITHHKVTDAEVFRVRRPFHSSAQDQIDHWGQDNVLSAHS